VESMVLRSIYVLRIAPGRVDKVPEALKAGCLFIGWGDVPQLLTANWTEDDFLVALKERYYSDPPNPIGAQSAKRNTWRFLREFKVGDIVVVPHDTKFYVTEVAGEPEHVKNFHGFAGFARASRWLNDRQPFLKDDFPDVRLSLLDRPACYPISGRKGVDEFVEGVVGESALADDIIDLRKRTGIDETTRKALIDARVGQGRFREDVLAAWGGRCAVTGCSVLKVLRASHAVAWRESTDEERLDPDNGLPLLANLDALFDAGLIAFDDAGEMLVSNLLPPEQRGILGVPARLRAQPTPGQLAFLRRHRRKFERLEEATSCCATE
jgi:hypothetical protein